MNARACICVCWLAFEWHKIHTTQTKIKFINNLPIASQLNIIKRSVRERARGLENVCDRMRKKKLEKENSTNCICVHLKQMQMGWRSPSFEITRRMTHITEMNARVDRFLSLCPWYYCCCYCKILENKYNFFDCFVFFRCCCFVVVLLYYCGDYCVLTQLAKILCPQIGLASFENLGLSRKISEGLK